MEQVVFSEQAIADRIRQIRLAYDDLVSVVEGLERVVVYATVDAFTSVPSCQTFAIQYAATANTVTQMFTDARAHLDMVIEVFRETTSTTYASNQSIADDFAAIENLRLPAGLRVYAPVPHTPGSPFAV